MGKCSPPGATGGNWAKTIAVSFATSFGEEYLKTSIANKKISHGDLKKIAISSCVGAISDLAIGKILDRGVLKSLKDTEIAHNRAVLKNINRAYKGSKKYKKLIGSKNAAKKIKAIKFERFRFCNKKWYKKVSKKYSFKLNLNIKKSSVKSAIGNMFKGLVNRKISFNFNFNFNFKPKRSISRKKSPLWRPGSGIW